MNKQELNKKLAKFAFPNATAIDDMDDHLWIHSPFGEDNVVGSIVVDFNSLDACFKWLVPKLWICELTMEEGVFYQAKVSRPKDKLLAGIFTAIDEAPSLALCRAIEKLIDSEEAVATH